MMTRADWSCWRVKHATTGWRSLAKSTTTLSSQAGSATLSTTSSGSSPPAHAAAGPATARGRKEDRQIQSAGSSPFAATRLILPRFAWGTATGICLRSSATRSTAVFGGRVPRVLAMLVQLVLGLRSLDAGLHGRRDYSRRRVPAGRPLHGRRFTGRVAVAASPAC